MNHIADRIVAGFLATLSVIAVAFFSWLIAMLLGILVEKSLSYVKKDENFVLEIWQGIAQDMLWKFYF